MVERIPGCFSAVVITEQMRARPAKNFSPVCAAAIHLESFNNRIPFHTGM
jgi:hypothetical protein